MNLRVVLFSLLLVSTAASAGKKKIPAPEFIPPTSNFHLRAAFDTDPSVYLGRFVPDGASVPDESAARKTICSQYITSRTVGGGGVEYDEVMAANRSTALGLGIPETNLKLGGESGASASLRAKYTHTHKMVADITNPVAFASCCRQNPGECTGRFIGEFAEGTGSIWAAQSSSAEANVMEALRTMGFDVEASKGTAWSRSRKFPNPVYFAFGVTEVPKIDCKQHVDNPAKSEEGMYLGSVSEPLPSEKMAREAAMNGAREQAVKYLGEAIATGSVATSSYGGDAGKATARFNDEQFVERAAEGLACFVKDELPCPDQSPSVDGPRYTARTLAFMPNKAFEEAAASILSE